jgi:membrane protein YqaA with SNARE-associated domain
MKFIIAQAVASSVVNWLGHWGAIGLFAVGIIDGSFIPIPGGTDLMTVLLSARNRELWWFYALLSTAGSVLGGYLTYRLAKKGGGIALEQRVSKAKIAKIDAMFAKWGMGTVILAAIMPPPFPAVPIVAGAGALNYPPKKFIAAFSVGRITRFMGVAYLASLYGRSVLHWFSRIHIGWQWILVVVLGLTATGLGIWLWRRRRSKIAV